MFDLEHTHIAALTDEDLRKLVGKLCEVEARAVGQPVSTVTYGGDQRAKDGGVDVRVKFPDDTKLSGSEIIRNNVAFQVKQEKDCFTASKINNEMAPINKKTKKNELRPLFSELIKEKAAYIIVNGHDKNSDSAIKKRVAAMRAAVAGLPDNDKLHLDFYCGDRLAQWVNRHPGVALWVRDQIKQPLSGWKPFGDWSAYPMETDAEYLPDDEGRIKDGAHADAAPITIVDGIDRMRAALAQPGKVVRLVGLSGMGKTRLAQALFDDRIGTAALDPRHAAYTDIGDNPAPTPRDMLTRLAHDGKTAVVIVDNCPPELHAQLVRELRGISAAKLSLLTIEYDVGDEDQKKETQAFSLEPASGAVIEKIIIRHHPHITRPNAGRIVEVAGGNARLALALAEGVNRRDNVARLSDRELFDRLFRQRNAVDDGLLRAAEAAALVYSFDGEALNGEMAELPLLAELAEQTPTTFARHIAELQRRKLVQQRGRWRAVMPQALALHLARCALEKILVPLLRQAMEEKAPARLLKSFSRRLGYLHDSPQARQIAAAWLGPGGLLGDLAATETWDEAWAMFENIAPVCPDVTLAAIQRAADTAGDEAVFVTSRKGDGFYRLLAKLTYDPALFDQAVWLLARAHVAQPKDDRPYSNQEYYFGRLFQIVASGTHAPQAQRMATIDRLLNATEAKYHSLGVATLGGMLRAPDNWLSEEDISFGARDRDFGWRPANDEERAHWLQTALTHAVALANGDGPHRVAVRRMLADSLEDLWRVESVRENIARALRQVAEIEFWPEGWAALVRMKRMIGQNTSDVSRTFLQSLEVDLQPIDLKGKIIQRLRLQPWEMDDRSDESIIATTAETRALGGALAAEPELLGGLAPALLTSGSNNTWGIGQGLADGAADLPRLWNQLTAAMAAVEREKRQFGVLGGFLNAAQARDPAWTASTLDAAVDDDVLGEVFPYLQIVVEVDDTSVERLHLALKGDRLSVSQFSRLAYGGALKDVSTQKLLGLLRAVAKKPGGQDVCVLILAMQFHGLASTPDPARKAVLVAFGRKLLSGYRLPEDVNHYSSHNLEEIIKKCMNGVDAVSAARSLTANLQGNRRDYQSQLKTQRLICALMKVQPAAVLDVLETGGEVLLRSNSAHDAAPLKQVNRDRLFAWANVNSERRYPWLAGITGLFSTSSRDNDLSLALALLDRAPDKARLMQIYNNRWDVHSWSGSKAAILEARRALLEPLLNHADPAVPVWAEALRNRIAAAAAQEREREALRDRELQSFE